MNKLIPVFSILGVGGAIGGSVILSSKLSSNSKGETFRNKYPYSLLNKISDNQAWSSRYSFLKGKTPKFPLLKEIAKKNDDSAKSKTDHKAACLKIYDTPAENNEYFNDFESYCSKHIEDEITGGSLITDEKTVGTKWDGKLDALKNLTGDSINLLSEELRSLKTIRGDNAITEDHRNALKTWCDSAKSKIFLGKDDPKFKDVNTYCVGN